LPPQSSLHQVASLSSRVQPCPGDRLNYGIKLHLDLGNHLIFGGLEFVDLGLELFDLALELDDFALVLAGFILDLGDLVHEPAAFTLCHLGFGRCILVLCVCKVQS
jgi:hypothetical protein